MVDQDQLEEPHMALMDMTYMVTRSMDSMYSMRMVHQLCNPRPHHRRMAGQLGVHMGGLVGLGQPQAPPLPPTPMPLLLHLSLHAHR